MREAKSLSFSFAVVAADDRRRRFLGRLHKYKKNCGKFLCNLTKCNFLKLFSKKVLTFGSIFGIMITENKK
jgi:hypothetical protein